MRSDARLAAACALAVLAVAVVGIAVQHRTGGLLPSPAALDRSAGRDQEHHGADQQKGAPGRSASRAGAFPGADQDAGRGGGDPEKGDELNWPDWPDWIQAGSAVATVLATFALLRVTRRQAEIANDTLRETAVAANAAARSADIAEQAMIYTQRAFLFSGMPVVNQVLDGDGKVVAIAVNIKWTNLGNTAARRVKAYADILMFKPKLTGDFDYRIGLILNADDPVAMLEPKRDLELNPTWRPIADFMLGHNGLAEFFIIGWVEYNDVFSGTARRRTEIFWRMSLKADPCISVKDINECVAVNRYGPHNGADEDCFHKQPMTA